MSNTVTLRTGFAMPLVGLGTWQAAPGEVERAVVHAIKNGYRHIDCAFAYGNEAEIGKALQQCFAEGICLRDDLFITTKLWNTKHRTKDVIPALQSQLSDLRLEYIDLYLVHWPHAFEDNAEELFPLHEDGRTRYSKAHFREAWEGMEKAVDLGLARSIGLSNFNSEQIRDVMFVSERHMPAVLQIESHPYLNQESLISFCNDNGIAVTAYSPLGASGRPPRLVQDGQPKLLEDPIVVGIAENHGVSPAQVLIRFQVQRNVITIPKSSNPNRIVQNFDVFSFSLTDDEMASLRSLNKNMRYIDPIRDDVHSLYPFRIPF